jgi:hypothetical protein
MDAKAIAKGMRAVVSMERTGTFKRVSKIGLILGQLVKQSVVVA